MPGPLATTLIIALGLGLAGLLVLGVARAWPRTGATIAETARAALITAGLATAWLALTWLAGVQGWFARFDVMPPMPLRVFVPTAALTVGLAFSRVGRRLADGLPMAVLVGFQAFRVPVEVALHALHTDGLLPERMTYVGWNLDIVTGLSAAVVGLLLLKGRGSRGLILAWSVLGVGLLLTILTLAIGSVPGPTRLFHTDVPNVVVFYAPGIWIPLVLVQAAILGHLLVFRKLAAMPR